MSMAEASVRRSVTKRDEQRRVAVRDGVSREFLNYWKQIAGGSGATSKRYEATRGPTNIHREKGNKGGRGREKNPFLVRRWVRVSVRVVDGGRFGAVEKRTAGKQEGFEDPGERGTARVVSTKER